MLSPGDFRDLVSGRRRGFGATLVRAMLRGIELPYATAVAWRNWRYDTRRATVHRVRVPVICVGNLTLGGTGKTPLVKWIARRLQAKGRRVTIVSRGYAASRQDAANDEALELEQSLAGVPHVQNPDRVAAARRAMAEFGAQVILLDDGFQHRRLARDLDIVLLDALEPFGFEHVFPRGTLRESLVGLARAEVVVLSRCEVLDRPGRAEIRRRVAQLAPHAAWVETTPRADGLLSAAGLQRPLDALSGQRVAAFCGIGNPAGFRHTLEQAGLNVVAFREFADHHRYERQDVEQLDKWAARAKAQCAVCTHKDLVKLRVERLGAVPLWALGIELEFVAGLSGLEQKLDALFATPTASG